MAVVRELLTLFGFKVDKGGARQAETAVDAIKNAAQRAGKSFTELNSKLQVIRQTLGAVRSVGEKAFKTLITDFTVATDEAAKTARAVGVTVGELQELNFGAQLSGAETQDVTKALGQLAKGARESSKGVKTYKEAFDDLGVKVTDGNDKLKGTRQLLNEVSDRFNQMENGTEKTALSMKLFGRTGIKLTEFLSQGSQGLETMGAEARRLGIVMSEEAAKKAENFNDEMLRAKSALKGVRNQIALKLLPSLIKGLNKFVAWMNAGDRLTQVMARLKQGFKAAAVALIALVGGKMVALVATFARSFLVALGPLAIMAAKFIILGAIAQDLFNLFTGKKSELAEAFTAKEIDELKKSFKEIGKVFKQVLKAVLPLMAEIVKALKPLIPTLISIIKLAAGALKVALRGVKAVIVIIAAVIKRVSEKFQELGPVFRALMSTIKTLWDATFGGLLDAIGLLIKRFGGLKGVANGIAFAFGGIVKIIGVITKAITGVLGLVGAVINGLLRAIGLRSKGFGAIASKLTEKDLAPSASGPRAGAGGSPVSDNSTSNINVSVAAGGVSDPEDLAVRVGQVVDQRIAARNRQKIRDLRGG